MPVLKFCYLKLTNFLLKSSTILLIYSFLKADVVDGKISSPEEAED